MERILIGDSVSYGVLHQLNKVFDSRSRSRYENWNGKLYLVTRLLSPYDRVMWDSGEID